MTQPRKTFNEPLKRGIVKTHGPLSIIYVLRYS